MAIRSCVPIVGDILVLDLEVLAEGNVLMLNDELAVMSQTYVARTKDR